MKLKAEPVDFAGPVQPGWPLKVFPREELAQRYPSDPEYDRALRAWLEYYTTTEIHDRRLPGFWSSRETDTWIPMPGPAASASNAFARDRLRELIAELHGIPEAVIRSAKENAGRLSYTEQVRLQRELSAEPQPDEQRRHE